ncbi:hypothetical protein AMS68_002336 [Peltaster fructicola]|uniref:Uncharacterized protein n=1 Tax=Peltaster fructicola TaxID=286661 RepID=A0A6H0XQC8_9PEZI|nr:hypothetical protein AMS68_002336 [Peltaster fructicola]
MSSALGIEVFEQPAGCTSGISCDKPGHIHHWPTQGQIMIERCEHYCLFCTGAKAQKRWSSAWFLRRHIRTAHAANEFPNLEISEGWGRRPDGNARPIQKKRPPPGSNRKRSKMLLMQRSPGMSTGNTPPLFLSTTPPAGHPYTTSPALIMQTGNNIGVAYDAAGNLLYPSMAHGQTMSPVHDSSVQSSFGSAQFSSQYTSTPATSFSDYNPNEVVDDSLVELRLRAALAPELLESPPTAATLQDTATFHNAQTFASAPELAFQGSTVSPQDMYLFHEGDSINPLAVMNNSIGLALSAERHNDVNIDFDISEFLNEEATALLTTTAPFAELQNVDSGFAAFANSAVFDHDTTTNGTNASHELYDSYHINDNTSSFSFGLSDLDMEFNPVDFDMSSTTFTFDS